MDAEQIRRLKPMLTRYLKQFDDCFARRDTRAHFSTYVDGQLSDLGEKSCEPIALAAGIPPRNLQEFLSALQVGRRPDARPPASRSSSGDHAGPQCDRHHRRNQRREKRRQNPGRQAAVVRHSSARRRTASSRCISPTPPAIFIACWTATCFCPRTGRTTATAAARRAFPTTWCIGRNGKSRWSFSTVPATTA